MKSLRTDDILGARPRIRHAPRILVRQPIYYEKSYVQSPQNFSNVNSSEVFRERSPYLPNNYQSHPSILRENPKSAMKQTPPNVSKQMPKISYTLPIKEQNQGIVSQVNPQKGKPTKVKKEEERIYSRGSAKSQNSKKSEEKANIFRGLGYNIITNHRYSIDMVNSYKNSTSAWLPKQ